MNVLEAADLIDQCIALGIWRHPGDDDTLEGQVRMWAEALTAVPFEFAQTCVASHTTAYLIRPSMIRGQWEERQKAARIADRNTFDERACPWARLCRCTHAEGQCYRGWLDEQYDRNREITENRRVGDTEIAYLVGRYCPTCWNARNERRIENNLQPIPLGLIGPHQ